MVDLERILHRLLHVEDALSRVHESVETLTRKVGDLMALADDLKAAVGKLDAETTRVGQVIDGLVARLRDPSLTPQQRDEVFAALDAVTAHLQTLGADAGNPVPPAPPQMAQAERLAGRQP